jgi:quercetin dioxygenase-like cupin family protein
MVEIPPDGSTPVHMHPANNYAFILEGQVTVEEGRVVDGKLAVERSSTFKKGDAFAEVVNTWHRGTAGHEGVKILVWYTTAVGRASTVVYEPGYRIDPSMNDSSCRPERRP